MQQTHCLYQDSYLTLSFVTKLTQCRQILTKTLKLPTHQNQINYWQKNNTLSSVTETIFTGGGEAHGVDIKCF